MRNVLWLIGPLSTGVQELAAPNRSQVTVSVQEIGVQGCGTEHIKAQDGITYLGFSNFPPFSF